jgi:hypothetical protein
MTEPADLLGVYLQDHYAGATAGTALFRRATEHHHDPEVRRQLDPVTAAVESDRRELRGIMADVGVEPAAVKMAGAWLGEKLGRLKPNGDPLRRTPLTDVVELEALRIALEGKAAGWRLLRTLADQDMRLDAPQFDRLLDGVSEQIDVVEKLRIDSARRAFSRTA